MWFKVCVWGFLCVVALIRNLCKPLFEGRYSPSDRANCHAYIPQDERGKIAQRGLEAATPTPLRAASAAGDVATPVTTPAKNCELTPRPSVPLSPVWAQQQCVGFCVYAVSVCMGPWCIYLCLHCTRFQH